jgi:hypothetical protein
MAHAISLTELNAALGDYCRENKVGIFEQLLFNDNFVERYNVLDTITDETPLITATAKSVVRPADPENFAPTNDFLKLTPRILKVRGMKVDLKIVPQLLYKSWISMGRRAGRADTTRLELEEFILKHVTEMAHEDLFLRCLYPGIYNANGTTPVDCMDGFLKIIEDEITAGNIALNKNNLVETGAVTAVNVIDTLESIHDKLHAKYKTIPTEMKVNDQIFMWFQRAMRAEFGQNIDYRGMGDVFKRRVRLEGTNCDIVAEPALGASQRIVLSPKDNLVIGTDLMSDKNQIDIEKYERTLKFMMDFSMGVEITRIDEHGGFVVNDQE